MILTFRSDILKKVFLIFIIDSDPDIEVVMGAGSITGDLSGSMRNLLGMTDDFFNTVYGKIIGKVTYKRICFSLFLFAF